MHPFVIFITGIFLLSLSSSFIERHSLEKAFIPQIDHGYGDSPYQNFLNL